MIKSFKDKALERCWRQGRCNKIPANLLRRVLMKLDSMDGATHIDDLENPPGDHLHTLKGKEKWPQNCLRILILRCKICSGAHLLPVNCAPRRLCALSPNTNPNFETTSRMKAAGHSR